MTLHDAVGLNGEKGSTILNIKVHVPSIWAKGCMLDKCALFIWVDVTYYPSVMEGEGHVMSSLLIINNLNTDVWPQVVETTMCLWAQG